MPATSASVPATATIDLVRARLGDRYALERELGRGGMGTVYLARDLSLDRPVALKVLPPEFATQTTLRERFLLETRTAAKFSHPNIVPVYAVEESEDLLAYTMGLVEGETLADRVQRVGPLTVREIVRLLRTWVMRSRTRTGAASSTATSSRKMSCSSGQLGARW